MDHETPTHTDPAKAPRAGMIQNVFSFFALSVGLGFTVWLIVASSLTSILHSVAQIGWGIAAIIAVRAVMITINAVAWRQLLVALVHVPFAAFAVLRWIREAIDLLLPVASIGGSLISARLLTYWRVSGVTALAGVFVDVLLQTFAQAAFALAGALLLGRLVGFDSLVSELLLGIAVAAVALAGFYVVQRYGGAWLIDRMRAIASGWTQYPPPRGESHFQAAMERIWHGRRRYLAAAFIIHVIAWTLGALEVWFALYFMQWPVTVEQAVVLESLGVSISTAAFFVPGSWGVQEGGFILIGQMLGLPGYLSLSLSLVKRIPDLALGAPGLVLWRVVEARHLLDKHHRAS